MFIKRFNQINIKIIIVSLLGTTFFSSGAEAKGRSIMWNPNAITTVLGFEGVEEVSTTFTSKEELHDVEIWVVPELRRFVRVEPSSFASIEQNVPYDVTVHISVPHGTYPGLYEGTIHLRNGRRTLPQNLKVSLEVFYEDVSIPPTTKILTELTTQHFLSVSPDNAILTFSEPTDELNSLAVGDIIIISVTPYTPYGLLRNVLGVIINNGQVQLETGPATFEDAFEQVNISLSHNLTPADMTNASESFQAEGVLLTTSFEGFYIEIDEVVLYDLDGDENTIDDLITANGYISLNPSFDFTANIEDFQLTQLSFTNTTTETAHVEVAAEIDLLNFDEKVEIARYPFSPIVIWAGFVPVVFTPILTVNVGADGSVSVGIESSFTQEATILIGLGYNLGDWYPIQDFSYTFDFEPPVFTAGCDFKGYIGPQLSLLLYGITGPYAELNGYLELEAEFLPSTLVELYGGIEASVGVKVEVLGEEIEDYSFPALIGYRTLLWSWTGVEGYISGNVKDAITLAGLENVTIQVFDDSDVMATGVTDPSGNYNVSVPIGENYAVVFTKDGYLPATYQNVSVQEDTTTYLEAVLQIDSEHSGEGNVSGRILNALDGSGVNGLTLSLREGINTFEGPVIGTTTTGASGNYAFTDLNAGHYTAEVSGTGYNTTYFTVLCIGGTTVSDQNATVTPILSPGETRIILTWGASPSDLDSHLTGPLPDGSRFHMYYIYAEETWGTSPWPTYVKLDRDDMSSYGPETTTIYLQIAGLYRFTVHDYTNLDSTSSAALSNSSAMVQVYRGSQLVATFHVPSGQGGTAWTVFEMNGETITPINAMYYASDPSGIQSLQVENNDLFKDLPQKDNDLQIIEEEVVSIEEAVAFTLFEAGEIIAEFGPEGFNNEESAFELTCAIDDVFTMLDEGMYFEVMVILEGDILERMDGCANTGKPDEDDWVTSIEGQALLYPLVTETIELLESLI